MEEQAPKLKVHQPGLHNTSLKRKRASPSIFGQSKSKVPRKRARTKQDFLDFCKIVLNYTQFNPEEPEKTSQEVDYNANSRTSPVDDSLGSNSDSGASNGTLGYGGSSTATAISSPSACSSEEDETITCFCNKPFANRPMIECGSCQTWIHLSCARIRRTQIPDVYICNSCRDLTKHSRKSARPRAENKKFMEEH